MPKPPGTRIRQSRAALAFLTLAAALLAGGCRHILAEKVTPYPGGSLHAAPWRLNREMLDPPLGGRTLFVVEHVAGIDPLQQPLDHLAEIAAKYSHEPAAWIRLGDPGSPDVATDRTGMLVCPSGPLDPGMRYVFIRYVGSFGPGMFGRTLQLRVSPECGGRDLYAIEIAQDTLAHHAFMWLTRRSLEENDLVHEFGHVLGLGSNPSHGFYPDYPDFSSGDHCVNPDCALASPLPKASVYRFFKTGLTFRYNRDYCPQCRLDIAQAQHFWKTGERGSETPRLPQKDLQDWIAHLHDDDFQSGGRAIALLDHGKEVMPALMKRIYTLPRDDEESPGAMGDWIAMQIVSREAVRRAGDGYTAQWADELDHRAMGWWWMKERGRFMAGSSWALPPSLCLLSKRGGSLRSCAVPSTDTPAPDRNPAR